MTEYQGTIETYTDLSFNQKELRLLVVCEIFQSYSSTIQKILPLLQQHQLSEDTMIEVYKSIIVAMESLHKQDLEKAFSHMDALHLQLEKIHQQEAEDSKKEDVDNLLQSL